ncbi:MAG: hypothetical protein QM705_03630 [Ancrocorticia sp.]
MKLLRLLAFLLLWALLTEALPYVGIYGALTRRLIAAGIVLVLAFVYTSRRHNKGIGTINGVENVRDHS